MSGSLEPAFELPELDAIRDHIARYDRPGPRYTSYPTAPVFSDEFGENDFVEALGRTRGRDLALYVHIPFCRRLCTFCACNRTITQDSSIADAYLDSLEVEAARLADALGTGSRSIQLAMSSMTRGATGSSRTK